MAARRADTSGQALAELAVSMFAVALVLSAIFAFARYITASLEARRDVRCDAGRGAFSMCGPGENYSTAKETATVEVSPLAADTIFGTAKVSIKEEVHIPAMGIDATDKGER